MDAITAGYFNPDDGRRPSPLVTSRLCPSPFHHASDGGDLQRISQMKKNQGRYTNSFAYRFQDHVRMGPNLSETVKGKLKLGVKIIQKRGRENIFKEVFGKMDGEKLLKASQCYLSTTAGPIAGLLFISTQKVAFCSERSITMSSPNGDRIQTPYKVVIPTKRIKKIEESGNMENPAQKYIKIVTDDNIEFWFMGFMRYEKAFQNLKKATSFLQS